MNVLVCLSRAFTWASCTNPKVSSVKQERTREPRIIEAQLVQLRLNFQMEKETAEIQPSRPLISPNMKLSLTSGSCMHVGILALTVLVIALRGRLFLTRPSHLSFLHLFFLGDSVCSLNGWVLHLDYF